MRELKDDDGSPACFREVAFCAEVGADLKKAHEELMRNVMAINSEGLAGQVIPVSRKAFHIGDAGNWDGAGLGIVISSRFSSL